MEDLWDEGFRQACTLCGLTEGQPICPDRLTLVYDCLREVAQAMGHGQEGVGGWV